MINTELKIKIEDDLSHIIQCRTISNRDYEKEDKAEFEKFHVLLKKRYPVLYRKFPPMHIGRNGLVFYIPGTSNPEKKPERQKASVLMAHYDVVPASGEQWTEDPFSGKIDSEFIWGRGAIDTKGTLCAVLRAAEEKCDAGWQPQDDLYLAFSGEEEIDGASCPQIVEYLKKNETDILFVLDEGGAIVDNAVPGQNKSCAMIGIAEKGSISVSCSISLSGGHASSPPAHTTAGLIAQGACSIEKNTFKAQFTAPVMQMFSCASPYCAQPYKFLFSHSLFFSPLLKLLSPLFGNEFNAMMHTTCAVTKLEASQAFNVVPPLASLGVNIRLLGKDTIEGAVQHLEKCFSKVEKYLQRKTKDSTKHVQVSVLTGDNPSRVSSTKCPQWKMLTDVITQQWPDVFTSPYLMTACTDSRHYGKISDRVYRFSPLVMTKEDRAMIHGKNERIKRVNLYNAVEFYLNLLDRL